jgi:8-oxo-dGTP pyrophosphatase MutT (NUDIX family)
MTPRRRVTSSPGDRGRKESGEPDFVMLLADPEIRLLMHADNVDEAELLTMLRGVSVQLRSASEHPKTRTGKQPLAPGVGTRKYRLGVGIMLINARSEIFIARRNDVPGNAWQMPQGGIDRGESPKQAAYRELKEEIGTDNAEVVAESTHWLYYDLPDDVARKVWGGRWKGQRQKWFVMRFKGDDTEINLATSHPEFDAWRWAAIDEVEALAVSFKRKLYVSLLTSLRGFFAAATTDILFSAPGEHAFRAIL